MKDELFQLAGECAEVEERFPFLPVHARGSGLGGSALHILDALPGVTDPAESDTVTVIGAGVAGLVAAHELEQLGYAVEVLEASQRIGGRVYTHRFGCGAEAPLAELGAMRIPIKHTHTMDYIRRLRLSDEVRPFESLLADDNTFLGTSTGYVRLRDAPQALLRDLRQTHGGKGYSEETLLFGARLGLVVNAIAPPALREDLRRDFGDLLDLADRIDLRAFITDLPSGRIDLNAVFVAHPELPAACSGDLRSFLDDILTETSPELVRIHGGMSRIVDRLSRRLLRPVLRRRQVVALDVRGNGVLIHTREGSRITTRHRRYAICTIPFPVLARMRLRGFSRDKLEVIHQIQYVPATKVAFHCREPFWENGGINGGASCSGGRIRQTYYPPVEGDPALGAVLLASYTIGADADLLGHLPPAGRYSYVLTELGQMHPELLSPGMVLNATSIAWGQHRWTGGGCAVRWGKDAETCEQERLRIVSPQGALFFAGEHCSSTPAWINGAIESARDAVADLVQSDAERGIAHPAGYRMETLGAPR
jgi:monoamine oxidase